MKDNLLFSNIIPDFVTHLRNTESEKTVPNKIKLHQDILFKLVKNIIFSKKNYKESERNWFKFKCYLLFGEDVNETKFKYYISEKDLKILKKQNKTLFEEMKGKFKNFNNY